MSFYSKRHIWQRKTRLFLGKNADFSYRFGTKIDAHYFGYKHNILYHKTLQLHTYFAHIFVRMILILK